MMARSKCSNQRPDTLMQDRSPPARRNHLQRTAGPYIWVKNGSARVRAARPFYPQEQTSSACPGMSVWCQHLHKRAGSGARPFEGANISPSEKHAGAMDEFMREFAALEPQPPELQQLFRTVHGN